MTTATLALLRVAAWAQPCAEGAGTAVPGSLEGAPPLDFVPAMQRRRLSRPARLALHSAHECLAGERADHIVWSSRHGDSSKTLDILHDLARQQAVSPTAFSTSVHNAPAGLYSILFNDDTPSSSLSAGNESLSQACWEAAALIASGQARRVLVVCYDEPAVPPYARFVPETEQVFALSLLLGRDSNETNTVLRLSRQEEHQDCSTTEAASFWRFWTDHAASLRHGHHHWERL